MTGWPIAISSLTFATHPQSLPQQDLHHTRPSFTLGDFGLQVKAHLGGPTANRLQNMRTADHEHEQVEQADLEAGGKLGSQGSKEQPGRDSYSQLGQDGVGGCAAACGRAGQEGRAGQQGEKPGQVGAEVGPQRL